MVDAEEHLHISEEQQLSNKEILQRKKVVVMLIINFTFVIYTICSSYLMKQPKLSSIPRVDNLSMSFIDSDNDDEDVEMLTLTQQMTVVAHQLQVFT